MSSQIVSNQFMFSKIQEIIQNYQIHQTESNIIDDYTSCNESEFAPRHQKLDHIKNNF